jgi:hypothetical protein
MKVIVVVLMVEASVFLCLGCQSETPPSSSGVVGSNATQSSTNSPAGEANGSAWKSYTHPNLGISVMTPKSWTVSPGKAFSAYSGEGLASVLMSRAQIIPRSEAETAADYLAEKMESFEKFEIGQPVTHLGNGQMEIAGTTGSWMEISLQQPKTWMRVICFVTDKPYIIFCASRQYAADTVAELNRELSFDEYRKVVVQVAEGVTTK